MILVRILSVIGFVFGIMTINSGSFALFGGAAGKEFAGNYVPFVLWFNFFAGFFYLVSGLGIFLKKKIAVDLAIVITILTALIFIAFALHIAMGGVFGMRTVGAMSFRTVTWLVISFFSARVLGAKHITFFNK